MTRMRDGKCSGPATRGQNATEKILINSNGVWSSVQYLLDALGTSDYGSIHGARAMMHQGMMSPPSRCVCGILEGFQCLLGRKSALPTPSRRKVAICLQLKKWTSRMRRKTRSKPSSYIRDLPYRTGTTHDLAVAGTFSVGVIPTLNAGRATNE